MPQIKRLPGETKADTNPRAQKEAAEFEAHQRAYDALKRRRCTDWLFWELCAYKPCRRHRGCAGDVTRCFDRFWPLVAPATAERRAPHPPPVRRSACRPAARHPQS